MPEYSYAPSYTKGNRLGTFLNQYGATSGRVPSSRILDRIIQNELDAAYADMYRSKSQQLAEKQFAESQRQFDLSSQENKRQFDISQENAKDAQKGQLIGGIASTAGQLGTTYLLGKGMGLWGKGAGPVTDYLGGSTIGKTVADTALRAQLPGGASAYPITGTGPTLGAGSEFATNNYLGSPQIFTGGGPIAATAAASPAPVAPALTDPFAWSNMPAVPMAPVESAIPVTVAGETTLTATPLTTGAPAVTGAGTAAPIAGTVGTESLAVAPEAGIQAGVIDNALATAQPFVLPAAAGYAGSNIGNMLSQSIGESIGVGGESERGFVGRVGGGAAAGFAATGGNPVGAAVGAGVGAVDWAFNEGGSMFRDAYNSTLGQVVGDTWLCTQIDRRIGMTPEERADMKLLRKFALRNHREWLGAYLKKGKKLVEEINRIETTEFYEKLKARMVDPILKMVRLGNMEDAFETYRDATVSLIGVYAPEIGTGVE